MERYQELRRASLITIVINAVLASAKAVIGVLAGSTAVLSDAVHSFSDVFTTVIVMVGLRFSNHKADHNHPYGHQRIESVVSLLLAFVLGCTALLLGRESTLRLASPAAIAPSWPALIVTVASIAVKEWMFRYTRAKAKRYNSTSLMSDAWHHRTDAISSVAVLLGVAGAFLGLPVLDPIAGIAVCLIILKAAWDIGKAAADQLIDRAASPEICRDLKRIALGVEGVLRIDSMRTRISNHLIFVDIEIAVPKSLSVGEGHRIAERVHDLVEDSGLSIEHCMVHVHPEAD